MMSRRVLVAVPSALGGRGVEEGVDGAAGERPGDAEDDAGDDEAAMGSAKFEGGDVEALAEQGGGEAEEDGDGGPDVGREVDGVGFEGVASGARRRCDGGCGSG